MVIRDLNLAEACLACSPGLQFETRRSTVPRAVSWRPVIPAARIRYNTTDAGLVFGDSSSVQNMSWKTRRLTAKCSTTRRPRRGPDRACQDGAAEDSSGDST